MLPVKPMDEKYIGDEMPGVCSQEDFDHDLKLWRKEFNYFMKSLQEKDEDDYQEAFKLYALAEFFMKLLWDKGYTYFE